MNRSDETRACTLELLEKLGGRFILNQTTMTLRPDVRVEISPLIDVPRDRFNGGKLATTITVVSPGYRTELPIILHAP